MPLNIKTPNFLNTSKMNDKYKGDKDYPYTLFIKRLEESWKVKLEDIKKAESFNEELLKSNITITPDNLKNKSLITYIDAPWGSGKTYFIENFLEWASKETRFVNFVGDIDHIKKDSSKGSLKVNELDIDVLDAWEIYNSSNIEEFLIKSFNVSLDEFKEFIKGDVCKKILSSPNIIQKLGRTSFLIIKKVLKSIELKTPLITIGVGKLFDDKKFKKIWTNSFKEEHFKNVSEEDKFKLLFGLYIESKYENNNKIIIVDNIERLCSKNRLDVINKIMNWSNLSGTTYIFLTNFQKINISTVNEEDFWNKISLYETFKLENDWRLYIDNYSHIVKGKNFDLKNHEKMIHFIKSIIPSFFSSNKDSMDIREIKKLLDNWHNKFDEQTEKELIISFMREVQQHIDGLDKYFFINKAIGILSEGEYWDLWKRDLKEEIEKISNETYIPLLNNKMFRIQSNFYELTVTKEDNILKFNNTSDEFEIREGEEIHFKTFNNFIDDEATSKFKKVINDIFNTRKIDDKDHNLITYLNSIQKNEIKEEVKINYFEFKYNNIRKIHIYNFIFFKK